MAEANKDYYNMLIDSAKKTGSIVCMGLDPVQEVIPIEGPFRTKVNLFYEKVFDRMVKEGVRPGAFKPNHGFYEVNDNPAQDQFEGTKALADTIFMIKESFPGIPVILDFKRADIKKSSDNYAQAALAWGVDAMTVSPYMGSDSVMPFIETGKGVYILDRTSNTGAADLQNLRTINDTTKFSESLCRFIQVMMESGDAKYGSLLNAGIRAYIEQNAPYLYETVAYKINEWSKGNKGVGAVFGATAPEELMKIAPFFAKNETPLLIPGVGGQGGSLEQLLHTLKLENYPLYLARINSSSAITHPWKTLENCPKDWDVEVVKNLKKLNDTIDFKTK